MRAPGRINLIGEHIDYCGLDVLPMAIQRSVSLDVEPAGDDVVRLESDAAGFEPLSFALSEASSVAGQEGWAAYPAAAVAQVRASVETRHRCGIPNIVRGFRVRVSSDLPPEAGLSSSSALTVASLLACIGAQLDDRARAGFPGRASSSMRLELALLAAAAERRTGTAGGGMDQAASLLGQEGHALRVCFDPLGVTPVRVPRGWRFVVAHSGERAAKSGGAKQAYNERVAAAAQALALAAEALDRPGISWAQLVCGYTAEARLEIAASLEGPAVRRFRHISTEAERVVQFQQALQADDPPEAGRILNASHLSLARDYDVSTAALDRLVDVALAAGARGARLTGAGLGGSIIALCESGQVRAVLRALRTAGFGAGAARLDVPEPFVAHPTAGATIEPSYPTIPSS